VTYLSEDDPPFLILHGTHDALVPYAQSVQFAEAFREKGVPVWLQTLPGAGHGGPAFTKAPVLKLMQDFFAKFLQGADVEIVLVPEEEVTVEPAKVKSGQCGDEKDFAHFCPRHFLLREISGKGLR